MAVTDDLADLARRTLADPADAALLVAGISPDTELGAVDLVDRHGVPTFLCEVEGALARAAAERRTATLTLGVRNSSTTVSINGVLCRAGQDQVDGRPVELVSLGVATVRVHHETDDGFIDSAVLIADYVHADQCSLELQAARLVAHLNDDHEQDLVDFVARGLARSPGTIASAWLEELDAYGADVHWVDTTGLRVGELVFPEPARCQHRLAELVRTELAAGRLHVE